MSAARQLEMFEATCDHREAVLCGAGWLYCPTCKQHHRPKDVDPVAVWLDVSPEEAVRRAAADELLRPLLEPFAMRIFRQDAAILKAH